MFGIIKTLALSAVAAGTLGLGAVGTALPAMADAGACPEGWSQGGASVLVGVEPAKADKAVAKEDGNGNGSICAKMVQGRGNTGAGYNVKDDRADGTIITVPIACDEGFTGYTNEAAIVLIATDRHNSPDRVTMSDTNANGAVCVSDAWGGPGTDHEIRDDLAAA